MKLVVDAGPIIALAKIDRLSVVEPLFDEVWLPEVVVHEVLAKPGLDAWKQEQAILAALTLPRSEGETLDDFAKRVLVDMTSEVGRDADLGSAVHAAIEGYAQGRWLPEGARFDAALASLRQRLNIMPLAVQLPLTTAEGIVGGAVDLIEMEALVYRPSEAKQGGRAQRGAALTLVRLPLTIDGCDGAVAAALVPAATLPAEVLEAAAGARRALVEAVAELEPEGDVAAMYLEESNVTSAQLRAAVCLQSLCDCL
jgi:hypothetical protein